MTDASDDATSMRCVRLDEATLIAFLHTLLQMDEVVRAVADETSTFEPSSLDFNSIQNEIRNAFLSPSERISTENRQVITEVIRSFREKCAILSRRREAGKLLLIYICNFHFLSHLLLNYICKLHWAGSSGSKNLLRGEDFLVCTAYTSNYTIGTLCAPINESYCRKHGYRWVLDGEHTYDSMMSVIMPRANCSWYKILLLLRLMEKALSDRDKVKYIMWIDSDAMIVDDTITLSSIVEECQHVELIISEDMNPSSHVNAGIFLIRVCDWSLKFLQDVWTGTAGGSKFFTVFLLAIKLVHLYFPPLLTHTIF